MTAQPRDDSWIDRCIDHFCRPTREADETPQGRVAGMDLDAGLVLAEIRALFTGRVPAISREVLDRCLADLWGQFGELHDRVERSQVDFINQLIERHYD